MHLHIPSHPSLRRQTGFTLIELSVVAIILVVLSALAVPQIREQIIAGRVSSSGQDITKAIVRLKEAAALTPTATPFASLPSVEKLFSGSNFKVSGSLVNHDLGDPAGGITLSSLSSGAAVALTVWGLHPATCPALANVVSKVADAIEVGTAGSVDAPAAPPTPGAVPTAAGAGVVKIAFGKYDASAAAAACAVTGQHNFMRFYVNG
ncbi:MAG: prepilin-type N-terminal cleavage/methylation domain-containing protein [Burkholderiaceae bacterium]|nr:prepilin-type N-terminal cleavage/methylation domain-containing protein [Burkholderiaceae bacterium]